MSNRLTLENITTLETSKFFTVMSGYRGCLRNILEKDFEMSQRMMQKFFINFLFTSISEQITILSSFFSTRKSDI